MRLAAGVRSRWGFALAALALCAGMVVRETARYQKATFDDFNYVQTGAQCLLAGCDPYSSTALAREAAQHHEAKPTMWSVGPVYPPSALLLAVPFGLLQWPLAARLFSVLAAGGMVVAWVMMAGQLRLGLTDPAAIILMGVVAGTSLPMAFDFGNPALGTGALVTIACLLLLREERSAGSERAGWVLLGVALAVKPQIVVGVVLALLWRRQTRRPAWKACGVTALLLLCGVAAYSLRLRGFAFLGTLRWTVAESMKPRSSSDFASFGSFDFLNLQTSFAEVHRLGRGAINGLAWATTAALAAAVCWLGAKADALRRMPWTLLALVETISLLPVYHRGYDRCVALVLAPAAMELSRERRWLGWAYAAMVTLWLVNDLLMTAVLRRWRYTPQNPLEEVVFCVVLLAGVVLAWRNNESFRHA